ncbi:MAG: FG-GAP repeat domain-containing protein [Pyrinomonadaceae bacterium]
MSKQHKKVTIKRPSTNLNLSVIDRLSDEPDRTGLIGWIKSHWTWIATFAFVLVLGLGVMAKNGWLPQTDSLSGKKTGWFGSELPKNAPSSWNPFIVSSPTPPQLSKEYVYTGSRLLTVEDARANAVPPTDLAVWRPSTGEWLIFRSDGESPPAVTWGQEGDIPIQGDYDGDGKTDFAVFRPSEGKTYIIRSSDGSEYIVELGGANDVPVPSDRDGDGKTDVVLWKTTTQDWTVKLSTTNAIEDKGKYGTSTDKPISGDFDGDGKADNAFWRSSDGSFHSVNSSNGSPRTVSLGSSTDIPVCADYDGDGKTDFAVLSGNTWTVLNSSDNNRVIITWQNAGDKPVPNDYDADGKVDIAVWHEAENDGIWYIRQSSDLSTRIEKFGLPGDIPVPANYRR